MPREFFLRWRISCGKNTWPNEFPIFPKITELIKVIVLA